MLGTNESSVGAGQILVRSKWREVPEKRHALVTGTLAVRSIYLHKEQRIHALVYCITVARRLLALALITRPVQPPVSGLRSPSAPATASSSVSARPASHAISHCRDSACARAAATQPS